MTKTSKYRSYGLVRDLNLSDIKDPVVGLESLLNNLPVTTGDKTFISEDLDVLRGLVSSNIDYDIFRSFVASVPVVDSTDPVTQETTTTIVRPIIRIEDAFSELEDVTGEHPRYSGGTGLRTTFIPSNFIRGESQPGDNWYDFIEDKITTNWETNDDLTVNDDIFITGEFGFKNKFLVDFPDTGGGLLMTGIFKPAWQEIVQNMVLRHTGVLQWELFDPRLGVAGEWTQLINTSLRTVDINVLSIESSAGDTLVAVAQYTNDFAQANANGVENIDCNVGVDMILINLTAQGVTVDISDLTIPVADIALDTITVTFDESYWDEIDARLQAAGYTPPPGDTNLFIGEIEGFSVSRSYSDFIEMRLDEVVLPLDPEYGTGYDMRLFWWYPNEYIEESDSEKQFSWLYPANPTAYTNFNLERPTESASENNFFNRIRTATNAYRPVLGQASTEQDGRNYKDFITTGSVDVDFNPSLASSWADVIIDNSVNCGFAEGANYLENTSGISGSAVMSEGTICIANDFTVHGECIDSVGQHFFKTKFPRTTSNCLIDVLPARTSDLQAEVPFVFTFLNGTKIKDIFQGTTTTNEFTNSALFQQTFNVKVDDRILIEDQGSQSVTTHRVISTNPLTYSFTVSPDFDAAYQNTTCRAVVLPTSGFNDYSKEEFCQGVFGYKTTATIASGTNTITLDDVTDVIPGLIVQFDGSIPFGTEVLTVDGVTNTITIDQNLTADIPIQAYVVFCPSGTGPNKESCVLPFDVSPPFVGTENGLTTNGNNIRSTFDPFNVIVNRRIESQSLTNVTPITDDYSFNQTLKIAEKDDGYTYKLIAKNPTP